MASAELLAFELGTDLGARQPVKSRICHKKLHQVGCAVSTAWKKPKFLLE